MSDARSRSGGTDDADDVEAESQVGAKPVGRDFLVEPAVRRRHDARVDAARHVLADAPDLPVLQHAQQLGLRARRQLADLVEEERAAVGLLEEPARSPTAPVNAPRAWPKSSASSRSSASAAQLTVQSRRSRRGPNRCTPRATSSLPLPLSPSTSTGNGARAARSTDARSAEAASLDPRSSPKPESGAGTAGRSSRLRTDAEAASAAARSSADARSPSITVPIVQRQQSTAMIS